MKVDLRKILDTKNPKFSRWVPNIVIRGLEKLIRAPKVNYVLENYSELSPMDFIDKTMDYIGVSYSVHGLERLDKQTRYIFAANHPLGGLDGMALARGLGNLNGGNVKLIVNDILMTVNPLRPIFAPINKHGRQSGHYAKMQRDMYQSQDNVITFPSGMCSRLIDGVIQDLPWKSSFVQRAMEYNREVVPVFVSGRNSMLFYRIALWRKRMGIKAGVEMVLLPREMFDYGVSDGRTKHLDIYIGKPVVVDSSRMPVQWSQIIRNRCYELNPRKS